MTPKQFKATRARLNLTQDALAERLGLSWRQIARYEAGTSKIPNPVSILLKIFKAQPKHKTPTQTPT